jgi:hypothetical protein
MRHVKQAMDLPTAAAWALWQPPHVTCIRNSEHYQQIGKRDIQD